MRKWDWLFPPAFILYTTNFNGFCQLKFSIQSKNIIVHYNQQLIRLMWHANSMPKHHKNLYIQINLLWKLLQIKVYLCVVFSTALTKELTDMPNSIQFLFKSTVNCPREKCCPASLINKGLQGSTTEDSNILSEKFKFLTPFSPFSLLKWTASSMSK